MVVSFLVVSFIYDNSLGGFNTNYHKLPANLQKK